MFTTKSKVDLSAVVAFDADGALQETADAARHHSRRSFLRKSGVALGGAAVAGGLLPGAAMAATPKGDVAILNFALTLEYLESAFYAVRAQARRADAASTSASRRSSTSTRWPTWPRCARRSAPPRSSGRRSRSARRSPARRPFTATAIKLEDTGVAAYQGQAPFIRSSAVFKAAISIHPVEARHAAWIRNLAHLNPAPVPFNPALTKNQVLAAVSATGFIK